MTDLNIFALVGRLTDNIQLRYSNGGYCFGSFTLASNRGKKAQDGSYQDVASYFDCVLYGKAAESLAQYLIKGQQVAIQGYVEQQRWEVEGQKRSKVVFNVTSINLSGSQKQGSQGVQGQSYNNTQQSQKMPSQAQQKANYQQYQSHANNYQPQGNVKPSYNDAGPEDFVDDIPF